MYKALSSDKRVRTRQLDSFQNHIKNKSDKYVNYFLIAYFLGGLLFAFFFNTWLVAIGIGGSSLAAYYASKMIWPRSNIYQYVLSTVLGIFMAQYLYQMHGMFEMHFVAFIGSAILITYQNWKLQIPLTLVVIIHYGLFAYLQFTGYDQIYLTALPYIDLQTFNLHILLTALIFFICGLWAHHFKKYGQRHLEQSFEIARLHFAESQKVELEKSNAELDRFVYSVSHDLRAPLCSMLGVIELSQQLTKDEVALEHLAMLKANISKLDKFINDILEYSRNARTEMRTEEINFPEILDDISNNLKYMSSNHRPVHINVKVKAEKVFYSDRSRINVVLNNLISNSIRYHNPHISEPFVNVEVDTNEAEANIIVKDNGIGIGKEYQEKVFDMFYRVSEASEGSGLGLYIVKEMIHKLDGQIELQSEPGMGTTFNIRIPNN